MIFDDETTAETGDDTDAETESVEVSENETAVAEAPAVDNESAADDVVAAFDKLLTDLAL